MEMPSCDVLGFPCFVGRLDAAVGALIARARSGDGGYACLGNAHVLVTALHDKKVATALNNAWAVFPDGAPVSWVQRRHGFTGAQRIAGPDLMPMVIEAGVPSGLTHFLLGSSQSTLDRLLARIEKRHPGVRITGSYSPTRAEIEDADRGVLDIARATKPNIIWCAFGAPRQELWMEAHAQLLAPAVLVGVGAAFDFLAGAKPRAPLWMQRGGLEWLHRLINEPVRLAGRYARTNSEFALRATTELMVGRKGERQ